MRTGKAEEEDEEQEQEQETEQKRGQAQEQEQRQEQWEEHAEEWRTRRNRARGRKMLRRGGQRRGKKVEGENSTRNEGGEESGKWERRGRTGGRAEQAGALRPSLLPRLPPAPRRLCRGQLRPRADLGRWEQPVEAPVELHQQTQIAPHAARAHDGALVAELEDEEAPTHPRHQAAHPLARGEAPG